MSKLRWVFIVLLLLLILVFAGWGLSAVARNIFGGKAIDETVEEADTSLDGVSVAKYTVDGPVVANSKHRSYAIEVSEDVVTITIYSNYGQKVIREKSYKNNSESFSAFIKSLEKAKATARVEGTDEEDDYNEKGSCPTGRRYILELDDSIRRWTTSCNRSDGTADGKMRTIRRLFARQVPDYRNIVEGTGLNIL